ncbi:Extended synaptotagmin-3 [Auxenochlorella protothecoides]|uniref:Extended synaptotagmin-3 n=1 Tax=Auxenochlorella protothecoides TaxID=3075 RepID=A0A087SSE7_AUXPR|nr:Extended synaptotagmin-3 [Auxenochlorella protothecoides]KFM28651.1 Extended synaptotagmin-3 [Auxenochlorella protothecoides]
MDDRTSREPGPAGAPASPRPSRAKAPETTAVDGESVTYQLQKLATMAFLGWLGLLACLIPLLWLWSWELVRALALGLLVGLGASLLHRFNLKRKAAMAQRLRITPGRKGMQQLLHKIPTWLDFADTEKLEWLNDIILKSWPYYDLAISTMVKSQVEPLMAQYKPSGLIKRIYFQKLTFGNSPVRLEGIRVDKDDPSEVAVEVDFRWSGDANIVMGIDLPVGGTLTRLAPKVSDLAVSGTARVVLRPLLDTIPGFGAALVSLRKPPIVRFHLDFGKAFGGAASAGAIRLWLDDFLRTQIAEMLLWPSRIVIPLLDESVTGPLDDLYLRHKGVLRVDVIEARDLPKVDAIGSADSFVTVYTTAHVKEKTTVKKNSLHPKFGEKLWLMCQEPASQLLYIVVKDIDLVNVKQQSLLQLNVLKGASNVVKNSTLLGRAALPIKEFTQRPGEPHEMWVPLGTGDFAAAAGCGSGRGEVHLNITFWPFDQLKGHKSAARGAVIVTLFRCNNLVPMDRPVNQSDPMVVFKLNKESKKSSVVWKNLNPRWIGEHFDWFHVPMDSVLEATVYDFDRWSGNEVEGSVEIDITEEIARAPRGDVTKTWELEDVPTDWVDPSGKKEKSTITLRIQWIPYQELSR